MLRDPVFTRDGWGTEPQPTDDEPDTDPDKQDPFVSDSPKLRAHMRTDDTLARLRYLGRQNSQADASETTGGDVESRSVQPEDQGAADHDSMSGHDVAPRPPLTESSGTSEVAPKDEIHQEPRAEGSSTARNAQESEPRHAAAEARGSIDDVSDGPDRPALAGEDRQVGQAESGVGAVSEPQVESRADVTYDAKPGVAEALGTDERLEFATYRLRLESTGRTREVANVGVEYDYQREHCGDMEYRVSAEADLPRSTWADGLNDALGLAQDAKYVATDTRSWFIPDSMPPAMRTLAQDVMDKRLIKYREVIDDDTNPIRGLEIIVNNPAAAQAIASRMNELRVPGIVRLRP